MAKFRCKPKKLHGVALLYFYSLSVFEKMKRKKLEERAQNEKKK